MPPLIPGQVASLTVGATTSTSVPLSWTAPTSGGVPTGYTINYGISGGTVTHVATGSTAPSYTLTGLAAATTYIISVQATNSTGSGTASSNASATTATASVGSAAPIPNIGVAPSAAAARVTVYQVKAASTAVSNSDGTVTLTLNALTAGSTLAVIANGGGGGSGSNSIVSSATGLTAVKNTLYGSSRQIFWFGASSALSGNTITFSGITDVTNFMAVESNAQGADHTYGILSCPGIFDRKYNNSNNEPGSTARSYLATAADPASATTLVLARTNVNGTLTLPTGITPIFNYPGYVSGGTTNHAGVAFQVPLGQTAPIAITAANDAVSNYNTSCAVSLNLYANKLVGNVSTASTQVVVGTPTPATIPTPVGGVPLYHQRNLAKVAANQKPRFTLGMFGASSVQGWRRLALASYAIGFAQARLDFAGYNTIGDTYGSTQYSGIFNAAEGVTGKMLCISFMPWSNNTNINDVASGDYDEFYTDLADQLISAGQAEALLRVTWELNEQYYYNVDIHNCPDQFVNAIRRVIWLMGSRPGAKFVFAGPAPVLVAGGDSNGDPTNYLVGADATGNLSADGYITAYLDNSGPVTDASTARIASIKNAYFNSATGSTSWLAAHAATYGKPIGYGEGACGGTRRNDGHGIGDIAELMTAYADECLLTDPVAGLMWWNDNGGGTDSWVTPITYWPNSSHFPATWEVFKARFGTPQADLDVANGAIPQAPGLTASFSGGVLTLASTKTSGDTVNYTIKQVSIPGTHVWSTWNSVAPASSVASNSVAGDVDSNSVLPPGFVSGGLLDCRVLHSNTLGNSPWTQVRINTATNTQVGSTVHYASTFGLNEDGTVGPTLRTNEIPPTGTIGSGSASSQAVTVQKKCVEVPPGTTTLSTITLTSAATAGNHVVLAIIGGGGMGNAIATPAGFTLIFAGALGLNQGGQIFFGPVSALTSNGVPLAGVPVTDIGMVILEETTGGFIEYAGGCGSYGRDSFSINVTATASQHGGAQSIFAGWDTAVRAISVSAGTIDATFDGANYGGFNFRASASISLPTGTHGPVNVKTAYNSGSPLTPEKPGYLCWTTYTSAPPAVAQPTLAAFITATGAVPSVPYGS